jgi:hypothetical protein
MQRRNLVGRILIATLLLCANLPVAFAQANGTLRGTIILETSNTPVHNVIVTITQLKRSVETDDKGVYEPMTLWQSWTGPPTSCSESL